MKKKNVVTVIVPGFFTKLMFAVGCYRVTGAILHVLVDNLEAASERLKKKAEEIEKEKKKDKYGFACTVTPAHINDSMFADITGEKGN